MRKLRVKSPKLRANLQKWHINIKIFALHREIFCVYNISLRYENELSWVFFSWSRYRNILFNVMSKYDFFKQIKLLIVFSIIEQIIYWSYVNVKTFIVVTCIVVCIRIRIIRERVNRKKKHGVDTACRNAERWIFFWKLLSVSIMFNVGCCNFSFKQFIRVYLNQIIKYWHCWLEWKLIMVMTMQFLWWGIFQAEFFFFK